MSEIIKTSLIITTYNDAEYLHRSLSSAINQTLNPLEIIIIDDGSDSNDAEILVNSYKKKTSIPLVFHKKLNGGPSSARNVGIKMAKGNFVFFLDADDELLLDSLEWRQNAMEKLTKEYASVYCTSIERIKNKKDNTIDIIEFNGKVNSRLVGRTDGVPGGSPYHFFSREVLLNSGGFMETLRFNEDFEFILRLSKDYKFLGVNKPGFIRHLRKESWSSSNPMRAFEGVETFLDIAKTKTLLPDDEITQRRKENRLSLVKKLIIRNRNLSKASPYIDEAFNYKKPQNNKERTLYLLNYIAKIGEKLKNKLQEKFHTTSSKP